MDVAPFESCIVCFKGDTATAMAVEGEAEWILAALVALGIDEATAEAVFRGHLEREGWTGGPDEVPGGRVQLAFRLCSVCAEKVNFRVGPVSGDVPRLRQPGGA